METFAVFILLAALVAYLVTRQKGKDRSPTNLADEPLRRAKRSVSPEQTSSEPKPISPSVQSFDAKTAHRVSESRVIEGRAYVTDGDTITIQKTQIRLFGIDAPELDHPYGKTAKWAMVRLCKGQIVRAEVTAEDDYGRTVARCRLPDGRDLSAEMVEQGLALDWPKFSGGRYSHLEVSGVRKKLWLADARQRGHMHVWERFEAKRKATSEAK